MDHWEFYNKLFMSFALMWPLNETGHRNISNSSALSISILIYDVIVVHEYTHRICDLTFTMCYFITLEMHLNMHSCLHKKVCTLFKSLLSCLCVGVYFSEIRISGDRGNPGHISASLSVYYNLMLSA